MKFMAYTLETWLYKIGEFLAFTIYQVRAMDR